MKGEVKGESKEIITVTFTPSSKTTAISEIELHLSEFEFVPQICRISGSGMPKPPKSPQSRRETSMENAKTVKKEISKIDEVASRTTKKSQVAKTLLTLKGQNKNSFLIRPSSVKSKKLTGSVVEQAIIDKMPKEAEKQSRTLAAGLNPNVLIFEENFVKEYHEVETQLKEREIKFFQCIGDPALQPDEKNQIISTKLENTQYLTEFKKENDLHRYGPVSNNERVIVPSDLKVETNCKWNILGNDLFSLRQRNLNNLVKMSTTILTRIRVAHRLSKLKARFDEVFFQYFIASQRKIFIQKKMQKKWCMKIGKNRKKLWLGKRNLRDGNLRLISRIKILKGQPCQLNMIWEHQRSRKR